jgi:hypothetical protein
MQAARFKIINGCKVPLRKSIADEKAKKSGDSNRETTEVRKVTLFTKREKRSKHKASS